MNKPKLISNVVSVLRSKNIRKPVRIPKQVFHISDDEGNSKDFTVKKTNKTVSYTSDDVTVILEAIVAVIENSLKHGEKIHIHGFGTFSVHKRLARKVRHPDTKEMVDVSERYVPKFNFGNELRMAAKVFEMSLNETKYNDSDEDEEGYMMLYEFDEEDEDGGDQDGNGD